MHDSGFAIIPNVLEAGECDVLAEALAGAVARGGGRSGNLRNLLREVPAVAALARSSRLLLRPLLLHASAPATDPRHRRVIHIEYGSGPLPGGLEWFEDFTA